MNYLDFELEIGLRDKQNYPITVVRSAAGEAREIMHFPFDKLTLENYLLALQNASLRSGGKPRRILSTTEQAVQNFGRILFDTLFTGEVHNRYMVSKQEAVRQVKGLRLKLRILPPELAALPWEFLYDSDQAEYVCLSSNTPIIRYLELPRSPQPLTVTLPLRILGMATSPENLTDLDIEREKQRIEKAIEDLRAKGLVELTWMQGQTWQNLQRAMRIGPWHIFHFIGHGGFDHNTDQGFIALADDEGQVQHLNATQLGRLLTDHRSLRLVVLHTCEGSQSSEDDIFSNTASMLVRRGIPAVLALQYEITDRAMIELFHTFYESLIDGAPVDTALSEARKAVSLEVANTVEWGVAALYMSSPDGILFNSIRGLTTESTLQSKIATKDFDVFLSCNNEDKPAVKKIGEQLKAHGILPWLDEWELQPGMPWQRLLEAQIGHIKSAAVFIGKKGIGPWQQMELEAFLREFVSRGTPVIPVLLPDAPDKPKLPFFLQNIKWVDFRRTTPDPLEQLIWGITGTRRPIEPDVEEGEVNDTFRGEMPPLTLRESEVRADVTEISLAINNSSFLNYQQLAKAIIRRMGATDPVLIESSHFESDTVWEISLPSLGLQLDSGKAVFCLKHKEENLTFYKRLVEIKGARKADFLIVVDFLDIGKSPPPVDPGIVWLNPQCLEEMINTSGDEVVAWLGRLIASEVKNFEDLIRYHTEGPVDLDIFFGREYELQRLSSGTARGGVIVGAHKSGKTSLLRQLSERLKRQNYVVGGPYTVHSTNFQTFFLETLRGLGIPLPTAISLESWSAILRNQCEKGKRLVLLLDEIDMLLEQDTKTGYSLGREMRALQNDDYCKFYLAGHNRLREAIALEGGPFCNFAEEIILTGLDEDAATRLIREPIRAIGFNVDQQQAQQIFEGTAGVAVLIQGFCRRLLLKIRLSRDFDVAGTVIQKIEEDPDYLNMVFDYYKYAQTWDSLAVMLITASLAEVTRLDITRKFTEYGVELMWDQLDNLLEFLVKFGVLKGFEAGRYRIFSKYLYKAIKARSSNTDAFLVSQLERGKRER